MIPWLLFLWVWILFQTDFDSSLWRVSREKPSSHPPILPSFPVSAPWTAAASPPKPARGISEVRGPSWPPPRARRGDRPKATPAGLVARDTKTDFPSSASHVCWRRFGVPLPAPRDPSLRKDQTGSSRSGLRERKEGPPPRAATLPTAPRPHLRARRGPTGQGSGAARPPPLGDPQSPLSKCTNTPSSLLGSQPGPPKPKPLQVWGSWPCPQPPSFLPPGPHVGDGRTEHPRDRTPSLGAPGRGRETHPLNSVFLSFFFFFFSFLFFFAMGFNGKDRQTCQCSAGFLPLRQSSTFLHLLFSVPSTEPESTRKTNICSTGCSCASRPLSYLCD